MGGLNRPHEVRLLDAPRLPSVQGHHSLRHHAVHVQRIEGHDRGVDALVRDVLRLPQRPLDGLGRFLQVDDDALGKAVRGGVAHTDHLYSLRVAWVLLRDNHGDLRGSHTKSD